MYDSVRFILQKVRRLHILKLSEVFYQVGIDNHMNKYYINYTYKFVLSEQATQSDDSEPLMIALLIHWHAPVAVAHDHKAHLYRKTVLKPPTND